MSAVTLLVILSVILLGAAVGRPLGWVAIVLATLALILEVTGTRVVFH